MNQHEFHEIFDEFNENYGGVYSAKIVDKIALFVKDISPGDLSYALTKLADTQVKAPSLGVIRGELREIVNRRSLELREQKLKQIPHCNFCQKSGTVEATKIVPELNYLGELEASYTFRCCFCDTPKIKKLSEQIPLWQDRHRKLFRLKHTKEPLKKPEKLISVKTDEQRKRRIEEILGGVLERTTIVLDEK
jgi:hypothetical protein